MKGIILAGGMGTRLYPITKSISKQLLPVYDKPMIYYPLSVLMMAGIKDILVITTPDQNKNFKELLKSGNQWGINIEYKIQDEPRGLADAFIVGESFIGDDSVALILGDNLFYGHDFISTLTKVRESIEREGGAYIFGSYVKDPERYGVVNVKDDGVIEDIVEKPQNPKSNWAVVGLYFYDNQVIDIAKNVKPSKRGEIEITTVNNCYLERKNLKVKKFGRGFAWLDTGTFESLSEASDFVKTIENRTGLKIGCPEEIAFKMNYIDKTQLKSQAEIHKSSEYGEFLFSLLEEK